MIRANDVIIGQSEGDPAGDPEPGHFWLLAQLRLAEDDDTQRALIEVVNLLLMYVNGAIALGLTEPARLVRREVRGTRSVRCQLNAGDAIFSICLSMREQHEPALPSRKHDHEQE